MGTPSGHSLGVALWQIELIDASSGLYFYQVSHLLVRRFPARTREAECNDVT